MAFHVPGTTAPNGWEEANARLAALSITPLPGPPPQSCIVPALERTSALLSRCLSPQPGLSKPYALSVIVRAFFF